MRAETKATRPGRLRLCSLSDEPPFPGVHGEIAHPGEADAMLRSCCNCTTVITYLMAHS